MKPQCKVLFEIEVDLFVLFYTVAFTSRFVMNPTERSRTDAKKIVTSHELHATHALLIFANKLAVSNNAHAALRTARQAIHAKTEM